jgi:hypothetical protein
MTFITKDFTGTATSDEVDGDEDTPMHLSIQGTFVGTIALQRSFNGGTNWGTVDSYTTVTEKTIQRTSAVYQYRLECTAYTSGTAVCGLGS